MKHLKNEKVNLKDVLFLSPKKYKNSMLAGIGVEVNELGDEFDAALDLPVYATIQGFKGLDAKIVILVDVEHIKEENFSRFLYIAGTRARTLLYIVATDEFWSRHEV